MKNLLFVFADQWRRDACSLYGGDPVLTPCMEDFASSAVVCTDALSTCPLCSPARASLLSGLYPIESGVFTNCKKGLSMKLSDETLCIGSVLKDNGYSTAYIGKWHLDEPEVNKCANPSSGAAWWDAYTPPGPGRHGFDYWHAYNAYDKHNSPHYWEDGNGMIKVDKWSPIHETDVAIDYIKNRDRSKPFALYLSWNPPHSPYDTAPVEFWKPYEDLSYIRGNVDPSRLGEVMHHTYEPNPLDEDGLKRLYQGYFAAVSGIDHEFGRLVSFLHSEGLFDDTIIVLTADHGDMLASHGLIAKHVWYEESIGVPFIIGGGGIPDGRCGTVFSSVDVPTTLLSILSIPVPQSFHGKDVSQDIISHASNEDSCAFISACPGREVFINEFKSLGLDLLEYGWRSVRSRRYTFVLDVGYRPEKDYKVLLYDNLDDPLQLNPLCGTAALDNPEGARLYKLLCIWFKEQHDPFALNLEAYDHLS